MSTNIIAFSLVNENVLHAKEQAKQVSSRNIQEHLQSQTNEIVRLLNAVNGLGNTKYLKPDAILELKVAVNNVHANPKKDFEVTYTNILSGLIVAVKSILDDNYQKTKTEA